MMTEAFLFHAWQCRLFNTSELFTPDREPVKIIHPGILNTDSGPDFMNARIRIGETLWAGNVEIHVRAGDWNKHLHNTDKAYSNIILHVVYEAGDQITRPDGSIIPVLVLKDKIDTQAWNHYQYLLSNKQWIPCASQIRDIPSLVVDMQLTRMVTERLERKTLIILNDLKINKYDWEETYYRYLARNFGFHINAVPFELLARTLPGKILAKHKANMLQTDALIFGTAGLLGNELKEDYPVKLKEEFSFLKSKFKLHTLDSHLWKFLRLRPANFPTIRLAQFSALTQKNHHSFFKILDIKTVEELVLFFTTTVSSYWKNHFSFGKPSPESNKSLGPDSIHNLIINTVVPFLFIYGSQKGLAVFRERALNLLDELPAEKNSILSSWKETGIGVKTASQSQGLIELKKNYCDRKKCLQCGIGSHLLKR